MTTSTWLLCNFAIYQLLHTPIFNEDGRSSKFTSLLKGQIEMNNLSCKHEHTYQFCVRQLTHVTTNQNSDEGITLETHASLCQMAKNITGENFMRKRHAKEHTTRIIKTNKS